MHEIILKGRFRTLLFSLIAFFIAEDAALSQVNTEKLRKHYKQRGFIFNMDFRFGLSEGNSEYVSADGTFRVDYNGEKNDIFIITSYDYKETKDGKAVNKGFVHLRDIYAFSEGIAAEAFVQQEFNEFLLLSDRKLLGGGGRFRIMDFQSVKDSVAELQTYLGAGAMYEYEAYDTGEVNKGRLVKEPLRLTSYLTVDWVLSERVNLWAVGYYQPAAADFSDFRIVAETGMEVNIIGKLFFTADVGYRFNSDPVGNVENYDLVIKNGIRLSFP